MEDRIFKILLVAYLLVLSIVINNIAEDVKMWIPVIHHYNADSKLIICVK